MWARVHERVAGRDPRLVEGPQTSCISHRRLSDELTEGSAEGAQAPVADHQADFGHRSPRVPQELLRALDTASQEVLVRRLAKGLLEAADEVSPRGVGLAGEGGNIQRLSEATVDQILRPTEMDVDGDLRHELVAARSRGIPAAMCGSSSRRIRRPATPSSLDRVAAGAERPAVHGRRALLVHPDRRRIAVELAHWTSHAGSFEAVAADVVGDV